MWTVRSVCGPRHHVIANIYATASRPPIPGRQMRTNGSTFPVTAASHSFEMVWRARGVDVWAALKALGRSGIAEMIDRCCSHARRFGAGLEAAGFPVLNEVVLNQSLDAIIRIAKSEVVDERE